jgi:DNA-binding NtrC family response regulator
MKDYDILNNKRILAVDDERDVLDVISEELSDHGCVVITAQNYETAREIIANQDFDLVILDIMGVDGFALLEACAIYKKPAAMLTAHAVNLESLNLAVKLGAVSFLPKEELARLPELVAEILDGLAQGKSHWQRLFQRLGPFFKEKLGIVWDDLEKPPYPPYFY